MNDFPGVMYESFPSADEAVAFLDKLNESIRRQKLKTHQSPKENHQLNESILLSDAEDEVDMENEDENDPSKRASAVTVIVAHRGLPGNQR